MNKALLLLTIFLLTACNQEKELENPAKLQIEEYNKKLINEAEASVVNEGRDFKVSSDDIVLGDPQSKLVFVEYFSPTCPHCVHYHKSIFPIIKAKYIDTNKIAYVIREFIGNKQDFEATILARCKGDTDNYLKFIDIILTKQDAWAFNQNYREILTNIGSLGGLTPEEFAVCIKDDERAKILMENTKLVASIPKFVGTPSFFINGIQYSERYTEEDLAKAIDSALEKIK